MNAPIKDCPQPESAYKPVPNCPQDGQGNAGEFEGDDLDSIPF